MGYIELDEKIIKEVEEVTFEKFHKIGNLVPMEEMESTLEDLLNEIDRLKEQLEDEKEQRQYYKPLSQYELTRMKEEDF